MTENSKGGGAKAPNGARRRLVFGGVSVAALGGGAAALLGGAPVGVVDGKSRARPVPDSGLPPRSVDVVVIGGGNIGAATALTLAERGISVALCEKGVIAGEASGRSMGYVDSQMLDPDKLELTGRSKMLWSGLNARTEIDTGYRQVGLVASLDGAEAVAGAETWLTSARGTGADGRIIKGTEFLQLFPGMIEPPATALYTPTDAAVEPQLAASAMAEAAQRKGAKILQRCAARGLETQGGRISAVVTEKGSIACNAVVLAAGAWSPLFAKRLGLALPQLDVFLSQMGLSAVAGPKVSLSAHGYGFRPQIDGSYSFGSVDFAVPIEPETLAHASQLKPAIEMFWPIAHVGLSPSDFWRRLRAGSNWPLDQPSPFEACRVMVPQFRPGPLELALKKLRHHFPVFQSAQVRDRWTGVISSTPDNMPVLSPVAAYSGLYVGTAFTYGLTMGPAAGEALADLAMGRRPAIDLRNYRFERFNDGTQLRMRM